MKTTNSALSAAPIEVLYEDEALIAVNKPAGLPTQATLDRRRPHVYGLLQAQLLTQNPDSYLALHHRLDKDTSGVLLFCKDKTVNTALSTMFKTHQFQKIYWALTAPGATPAEEWQIDNYLAEKPLPRSQRMRLESVRAGGQKAVTDFRTLQKLKKGLWIEARPRTGRMHQIRVHLAEAGLPILGDDLYGSAPGNPSAARMMLHAYQLVFKHPVTGESLTITAPPPEDFQKKKSAMS